MIQISPWQRRIQRAEEVSRQYPYAAEILGFYIHLARFQEDLHRRLSTILQLPTASLDSELSPAELSELSSSFDSFLAMVKKHAPVPLVELAGELGARGRSFWIELLAHGWVERSPSAAHAFLAQAFLQPYAELLRSRATPGATQQPYALCPFCHRKPCYGILRQMGDGAARSMVCAFCLAEWEFRRLVCPGCGEEDDKRLPVFTATDFDYIRVEGCNTCRTYTKSIDLTKNGHAEPLVDELASAPLDLWAQENGYSKLQNNLLGM